MKEEEKAVEEKDDDLLKVAEAAAILRVHRSTVYRWMHSGRLPYVVYGARSVRFVRKVVRESGRQHAGRAEESEDGRAQTRRPMARRIPVQRPPHGEVHTIPPHDWSRDNEG